MSLNKVPFPRAPLAVCCQPRFRAPGVKVFLPAPRLLSFARRIASGGLGLLLLLANAPQRPGTGPETEQAEREEALANHSVLPAGKGSCRARPCVCLQCLLRKGPSFMWAPPWYLGEPASRAVMCPCDFPPGGPVLSSTQLTRSNKALAQLKYQNPSVPLGQQPPLS